MNTDQDAILAVVAEKIRAVVNEDWVAEYDIQPETRFNQDLEIESIEFVVIADAIQKHYGTGLNISGWLSGKSIHELIALSVGDVVGYISQAHAQLAKN